jgi:hypothetical protein
MVFDARYFYIGSASKFQGYMEPPLHDLIYKHGGLGLPR